MDIGESQTNLGCWEIKKAKMPKFHYKKPNILGKKPSV